MAFDVQPIASDIADGILAWCGVTSPTPAEVSVAEMAASAATEAIIGIRKTDTLESQYKPLAIRMGVYLYQKRGVDGVTSFGENGVQRSFEKGDLPPSMLCQVVPPVTVG